MGETGKLLQRYADERDGAGLTALHRATSEHLPEIAKDLIDGKVDINAKARFTFTDFTALHIAVYDNQLEIGRMLLDAGADVGARTGHEETPLDFAIQFDLTEFKKMIWNKK